MAGSALRTAAVVLTAGSLVSCNESPPGDTHSAAPPTAASAPRARAAPVTGSPSESSSPPRAGETGEASVPRAVTSDGRPRQAKLSVPALGLHGLTVVPYAGETDDARGTRIQDRGVAASPYGPRGGVGPGGIGNYQVTAHRTSSTHAFRMLPSLRVGQSVTVVVGGVRYVYEIRGTRTTSFRSPRSLAEQRAAVPGHPLAAATRAFLTLSTCATLEDHARGNYWADEFTNPEHRIDKIGLLVRTQVAG